MADPVAPVTPNTPAETTNEAKLTPPPGSKTPPKAEANALPGEKTPPDPKAPTVEELFDVNDGGTIKKRTRDQVIRDAQKGLAFEKRLKQSDQQVQKAQKVLEMIASDPFTAVKELGGDPIKAAQDFLARHAEDQLMSPEQKQQRDMQQRLSQYENQDKQRQEQAQQAQQAEADKRIFASLEKGFIAAAERNGLEGTPENLYRMIEVASEAMEHEIPLSEDQIVQEVKEREDDAFSRLEKRVLGGLKGEALAQRLGPAVVEEIVNWTISKFKNTNPYKKTEEPEETDQNPSEGYLSENEWSKQMNRFK